jgi:membrane-bound acyltransferase YfiQ involved in biofilm formation
MDEPDHDIGDDRLETELEHLLQELRVALPGVQILFAFLLTVPFANRFEQVTPFQEDAYLATLIATFAASVCLIAPTSYHRLRFRRHSDPERMLNTANMLVIAGMGLLAVALTSAILFVTDFLFGRPTAVALTTAGGLLLLWLWYAIPLSRYLAERR